MLYVFSPIEKQFVFFKKKKKEEKNSLQLKQWNNSRARLLLFSCCIMFFPLLRLNKNQSTICVWALSRHDDGISLIASPLHMVPLPIKQLCSTLHSSTSCQFYQFFVWFRWPPTNETMPFPIVFDNILMHLVIGTLNSETKYILVFSYLYVQNIRCITNIP